MEVQSHRACLGGRLDHWDWGRLGLGQRVWARQEVRLHLVSGQLVGPLVYQGQAAQRPPQALAGAQHHLTG
jgi:hypothetical protein